MEPDHVVFEDIFAKEDFATEHADMVVCSEVYARSMAGEIWGMSEHLVTEAARVKLFRALSLQNRTTPVIGSEHLIIITQNNMQRTFIKAFLLSIN